MTIINDLNFLLNNLKNGFNNEAPIIDNRKIVRERQEYVLETDILSQEHLMKFAKKYHPDSLIISEELDNYQNIEQHSQSLVVFGCHPNYPHLLHLLQSRRITISCGL